MIGRHPVFVEPPRSAWRAVTTVRQSPILLIRGLLDTARERQGEQQEQQDRRKQRGQEQHGEQKTN